MPRLRPGGVQESHLWFGGELGGLLEGREGMEGGSRVVFGRVWRGAH